MTRSLLLLALLSPILLGGVRESAPILAQDEIIRATGSLSEALITEGGDDLQRSHIELSFPTAGGEVTGEWSVVLRTDFGLTEDGDVFCIFTLTLSGRLQGTYDGGGALDGTTTLTATPSNVVACEDIDLTSNDSSSDWSGTFVGEQIALAFEAIESPLEFVATVSAGAEISPGDQDGDNPPADPPEDAEPPGNNADFVDIILGSASFEALSPRIEELTNCAEPEVVDGQLVLPGVGDCPGQLPGYRVAERFKQEFKARIPDFSFNEEAMRDRMYTAIFLAGMVGPGGQPVFPSIIAAMPVIKRLADLSVLQPAQQEEAIAVVNRFVELLAAQDAAGWEKRFP